MRKRHIATLVVIGLGIPAWAQERAEIGGLGLFTAYRSAEVVSGPSIGSIGFQPGPAGGGFIGQTMSDRFGGEIRYLFSRNNLKLSSGGTETTFSGRSHTVHYDFLFYTTGRRSSVRPYLAAGGGLKVYEGTGAEQAFQPLSNLALLTRTRQTLPAGDFGGGVKLQTARNMMIRVEFRDYITEAPKVFEPSPGAKFSGLLHQWAPIFGISWTF